MAVSRRARRASRAASGLRPALAMRRRRPSGQQSGRRASSATASSVTAKNGFNASAACGKTFPSASPFSTKSRADRYASPPASTRFTRCSSRPETESSALAEDAQQTARARRIAAAVAAVQQPVVCPAAARMPSVEQLVAQRSNLMQLLSLWFGEHFVKTRSDGRIDCTTPMICESMLCNTYDYACKQCSRSSAHMRARTH